MADATYTTGFAIEQGADRAVVRSGGSLDVESGGEIDVESGGALKINGTALTGTAAELNKLAGVTAGTVTASKAVVVGANKNVDTLVIADGGLYLGAGAGTSVTATAAELNLLDLSTVGALHKVKKIAVAAGDWSAETDSTWDLPAKALVYDVFIDVTTADGGKTVDIGTKSGEAGGDADGFANDLSLGSTGIVRPGYALDGGAAYYATTTRGALLAKLIAGANADDRGLYAEFPYATTANTAKSVTYTTSAATTAVWDLYIVYVELG